MNASPLSISILLMLASFGSAEAAPVPSDGVALTLVDERHPAGIVPLPDLGTPATPEAEEPLPFLIAA